MNALMLKIASGDPVKREYRISHAKGGAAIGGVIGGAGNALRAYRSGKKSGLKGKALAKHTAKHGLIGGAGGAAVGAGVGALAGGGRHERDKADAADFLHKNTQTKGDGTPLYVGKMSEKDRNMGHNLKRYGLHQERARIRSRKKENKADYKEVKDHFNKKDVKWEDG